MLASVSSLEEARVVVDAGADIIDLKNPAVGPLASLDPALVEEMTRKLDGIRTISATIGDLPYSADLIEPSIRNMATTGVDIIKAGVYGDMDSPLELQVLKKLTAQGIRIVLVLFAEDISRTVNFEKQAAAGIYGIMLDTREKQSGTLTEKLSKRRLRDFVAEARRCGLLSGLAGSLGAGDITPLLPLEADYLGFRGGLCSGGIRANGLDPERIRAIRSLIPVQIEENPRSATII